MERRRSLALSLNDVTVGRASCEWDRRRYSRVIHTRQDAHFFEQFLKDGKRLFVGWVFLTRNWNNHSHDVVRLKPGSTAIKRENGIGYRQ